MELVNEKTGIQHTSVDQSKADRVEITFYTDPLCCWSWGFEPQWRRLQYEFRDQIIYRNVMGGLLPSWKNYNDPVYSVSRPMQMGSVWLEAGRVSGMPMNDKLWVTDPPASSYPACIAVKCAESQSAEAGQKYLRMLREAVMIEGKNIAKQNVLTELARKLAAAHPNLLDTGKFEADLTNDKGLEAFRKDWQETQNRNITRFPTLILRSPGSPAIMLTGYRPYPVLLDAIKQIAPEIKPAEQDLAEQAYLQYWDTLTPREIEEVKMK